jgi:hypothetical protein
MGYTFTTALPNPEQAAAGSTDTATLMPAMGSALNYAHANNTAQVIHQAWLGGIATVDHNAASSYTEVCRWRVPVISSDHITVYGFVRGENTANTGGLVRLTAIGSGNSVEVTFTGAVGAKVSTAIALNISTAAAYEDIKLEIRAKSGGTVALHDVDLQHMPKGSPLSAGVKAAPGSNRFIPMGSTTLSSTRPFSAALGRDIVDSLECLEARAETILCWSGFDLPSSSAAISSDTDANLDIIACPIVRVMPDWSTATIWVRAKNATASKAYVTVCATNPPDQFPSGGDGPMMTVITIPANAAAATWYSATLRIPFDSGLTRSTFRHCLVGVLSTWTSDSAFGAGTDRPRPSILSVSIWGNP